MQLGKSSETRGRPCNLSRHKPCIQLSDFFFLRLVEVYKTCISTKLVVNGRYLIELRFFVLATAPSERTLG